MLNAKEARKIFRKTGGLTWQAKWVWTILYYVGLAAMERKPFTRLTFKAKSDVASVVIPELSNILQADFGFSVATEQEIKDGVTHFAFVINWRKRKGLDNDDPSDVDLDDGEPEDAAGENGNFIGDIGDVTT